MRVFQMVVIGVLAARVGAAEPLAERVHPEASLRIRAQFEDFDDAEERYRLRLRGRLGATFDAGEGLDVGARLTTGSADPTSSQLTFGSEFDKQPLKLDRAFLRLRRGRWLELMVGKVPPAFRNRRLIWDRDVQPEGATQAVTIGCPAGVEAHATFGEYVLLEVEDSPHDPMVLVGQAGVALRRGGVDLAFDVAVHDYRDVTGVVFTYAHGANTVDADGRLVGRYGLVDALLEIGARTPLGRVRSYLELVRNVRKQDARDAFALGFELERGRVRGGYELRRVERDAILDALAETAWYVERTGFLGHKASLKRSFAGGWMLGSSLAWMRAIGSPAAVHIDWSVDAEWQL